MKGFGTYSPFWLHDHGPSGCWAACRGRYRRRDACRLGRGHTCTALLAKGPPTQNDGPAGRRMPLFRWAFGAGELSVVAASVRAWIRPRRTRAGTRSRCWSSGYVPVSTRSPVHCCGRFPARNFPTCSSVLKLPRQRHPPVRLPPPPHPPRNLASPHGSGWRTRIHPTRMDRPTTQPHPQPTPPNLTGQEQQSTTEPLTDGVRTPAQPPASPPSLGRTLVPNLIGCSSPVDRRTS